VKKRLTVENSSFCYLLQCRCLLQYSWLCHLWNTSISPAIAEAVIKGSGAETSIPSGGQTKVASTALYVLMQRAVVPGCPLSGLGLQLFVTTYLFRMIVNLFSDNLNRNCIYVCSIN